MQRRAFCLAILSCSALAASGASLQPASAAKQSNASLDQVSSHIKAVGTMTANFTQRDRSGQVLSGTLTLKRPGKVRFEYQKDAGLLVVGNGRSLSMIDYQVNQVQRWPIKNSPLSALLDPKRDLSKYGRMVPTTNPNVLSVEVRDKKRPEYGVITMIFLRSASAPGGLTLDGWVALDSQNNRTTIRLKDQKYNRSVSDNAFKWTDPRKKKRVRR